MRLTDISVKIPEDILFVLNESKDDFVNDMRLLTAMDFYRKGKLSLGQAATLAGMEKIEFFFELGNHNVAAIDYDEDDIKREISDIEL